MEWIDTPESSNLERFGYDATNQTLRVEFNSGGIYDYFDVSEPVFEEMKNAPSKGSFLANQIKGVYRYARL